MSGNLVETNHLRHKRETKQLISFTFKAKTMYIYTQTHTYMHTLYIDEHKSVCSVISEPTQSS